MNDEPTTVYEVRWDASTAYQTRTRRQQFGTMADAAGFKGSHTRGADMSIFKIVTEKVG